MRYQLRHYVNGVPYAVKGRIVDVPNRPAAMQAARSLYGIASGGAEALDVECMYCEDQPVENGARWADSDASPTAPCPRCGRHPIELSQEVTS